MRQRSRKGETPLPSPPVRSVPDDVEGPAVVVTRGGRVESRHRVHVAVADPEGRLVLAAGDPERVTFYRSAAKPFQALPLVEDGVVEALGLTPEELALCCGSHSGESRHVEGVRSILEKVGVGEDHLECGPHPPLSGSAAATLWASGGSPGPIHNNCSGKHAGMLALARHHRWEPAGYVGATHPVQRRMLAEIVRWTGLPEAEVVTGVDGCGVVCFAAPLLRMAASFARFAEAAARGEASQTVVEAMTSHPYLVAGPGRLDTALMGCAGDRLFSKTGAEGVHAAGLPRRSLGVAIKVEDGARRAADAALVAVLDALEVLDDEAREALRDFGDPPVENTRGEVVGRVVAGIELAAFPATT